MPFGRHLYRWCPHCDWMGARSNHGKRAGKMAGVFHATKCPMKDAPFEDFVKPNMWAWEQWHLRVTNGIPPLKGSINWNSGDKKRGS